MSKAEDIKAAYSEIETVIGADYITVGPLAAVSGWLFQLDLSDVGVGGCGSGTLWINRDSVAGLRCGAAAADRRCAQMGYVGGCVGDLDGAGLVSSRVISLSTIAGIRKAGPHKRPSQKEDVWFLPITSSCV